MQMLRGPGWGVSMCLYLFSSAERGGEGHRGRGSLPQTRSPAEDAASTAPRVGRKRRAARVRPGGRGAAALPRCPAAREGAIPVAAEAASSPPAGHACPRGRASALPTAPLEKALLLLGALVFLWAREVLLVLGSPGVY